MRKLRAFVPALLVLTALGITPSSAIDEEQSGLYRLDPKKMDDILKLPKMEGVHVLLASKLRPKLISDAHIHILTEWIERGGILWLESESVESEVVRQIVPINVDDFKYTKSGTGKPGGELVVRGVSPRLVIGDHPLTEGVSQLYVYPRRKFDGTRKAEPIVEMTDTEGNHGLVIAAIRMDAGYVVLDGTARDKKFLFGRLRGFDSDHPNALSQPDGGWNSYDWEKLLANARDKAKTSQERVAAAND